MSKFGDEISRIKSENDLDVKYIKRGLRADGYTKDRLERLLKNEREWTKAETEKKSKCRMSKNVIQACEELLNNQELFKQI